MGPPRRTRRGKRRIHVKILVQTGIVFGLCWLGVCIEAVLPFSFPASVISMLLLLALLALRVLKVEHIQEKSDFLLANIPFFFIPPAVSILEYLDIVGSNLAALLVVCTVSTLVTFAATVWAVRATRRLMERRRPR